MYWKLRAFISKTKNGDFVHVITPIPWQCFNTASVFLGDCLACAFIGPRHQKSQEDRVDDSYESKTFFQIVWGGV